MREIKGKEIQKFFAWSTDELFSTNIQIHLLHQMGNNRLITSIGITIQSAIAKFTNITPTPPTL